MTNYNPTQQLVQYNRDISLKLSEICTPLFKNFGFTSFGYTRIREDGARFLLETNNQWLNFYSQSQFGEADEGPNSLLHNLTQTLSHNLPQEFYVKTLTGNPQSKIHDFLFSHDLWNSISIYVHMNKYIEVFHLATTRDNQTTVNFCVTQKQLIQQFLHYFRDKIYNLNIEAAPHIMDKNLCQIFNKKTFEGSQSDELLKFDNFLKEINIKKFFLKTHNTFISMREAECLHHLALGRSYKETARILQISARTIETHIMTLKYKLKLNATNELITLAHENYITDFNFSKDLKIHG